MMGPSLIPASAADHALAVALASLTGRVEILESDALTSICIDVRAFGAVGDGTADDTEALQDALDAAGLAVSSGIASESSVYFPSGTYLSDPLYVSTSNLTLFGDGMGASILKRKPATVTNQDSVGALNVHGSEQTPLFRVQTRDLCVDANKDNITVEGDIFDVEAFSFKWTNFALVERCRAINATSEGFDFDDCADGEVVACISEDCDGCGVHFSNGCVRMRGRGCRSIRCGVDRQRGAFDIYNGVTDSGYSDCHTEDCYRGLTVSGTSNDLVGCTALGSINTGIRLEGSYNTVTGCRAKGTVGNGLTIAGVRNVVTGGMYNDNTAHGIATVSGANNNAIVAAVCYSNANYGISLVSGTNNNIATACQVGGNPVGGIIDNGSGNQTTGNIT